MNVGSLLSVDTVVETKIAPKSSAPGGRQKSDKCQTKKKRPYVRLAWVD